MIAQYGLGFLAGLLSLLAPCVLPLIPIVFGSSMQSTKIGPVANAMGLTLSFTVVGILTSLFSSIFDFDVIQKIGAGILILVGIAFVVPKFKDFITLKLGFISSKGNELQNKIESKGFISEFLMGCILGMIWGPCSGPTLGFAFGIATQAEQSLHAMLIFFFFGLGAGLGLVGLGLVLRKFSGLLGTLMKHNKLMNNIMGAASILIGILILTGQLANVEQFILDILPQWFINISVMV